MKENELVIRGKVFTTSTPGYWWIVLPDGTEVLVKEVMRQ